MMIKDEGNTLFPGQRIRKVQVLSRSKKKTEPKQLQTKEEKNHKEIIWKDSEENQTRPSCL